MTLCFYRPVCPTVLSGSRIRNPLKSRRPLFVWHAPCLPAAADCILADIPSISPLIAAVAGEYFPVDPTRQIRPVITFQSKFFRDNLPNETWELYRMGWASIEWTPEEMRNGLPDRDESLNAMRRRMLLDPTLIGADREMQAAVQRNLLGPPKAMVAIGGMEGIAEEAAMFLDFRSQSPQHSPRRKRTDMKAAHFSPKRHHRSNRQFSFRCCFNGRRPASTKNAPRQRCSAACPQY